MTLRQLLALFRRMLVADMTPAADRAEVEKARAGDVHSRKVMNWTELQLAERREREYARARNLFQRGLVSSAADAWIASMASDGLPHVVEVES